MARHQVRRLPVVENGRLVGIVAQADIALSENETKTGELVVAISEPSEENAGSSPGPQVFIVGRCSECVRGRLPLPEALRDELGPLLLAPAVQHLEV